MESKKNYSKKLVIQTSYLSLLFGAILAIASPQSFANECERSLESSANSVNDLHHATRNLLLRRDKNQFITYRNLDDYEIKFGPMFTTFLKQLKGGMTWLDSGSGEGQALMQFQKESYRFHSNRSYNDRPNLIALAFMVTTETQLRDHYIRVLSGRLVEEIPPSEIGRVNLITDFYGPFLYALNPDQILAWYFNILLPGGKIFIYMNSAGLMDSEGKFITLEQYLATTQGIDVDYASSDSDAFVITVREPKVALTSLPRLELLSYGAAAPPIRQYKFLTK